jgi:aminoglycoside 3-N-acetyltransferase
MATKREAELIAQSPAPVTTFSLIADFKALGIQPGSVLLVHSAMSQLGWVCGGPVAVVLALEEVLGDQGTLVMPTHCGDNSDPAAWSNPPVPPEWFEIIRQHTPPYDPNLTPTRGMGRIVETFRTQPGTLRSAHPQLSFAARGPLASHITADHFPEVEMGEGSPLQKIYALDGWVLLLGVGHGNNTSLHLAEYRADYTTKQPNTNGCSMWVNDRVEWFQFPGLNFNDEDFPTIGAAFEAEFPQAVIKGKVGLADAALMRQRPLVDFAVQWMHKNRK